MSASKLHLTLPTAATTTTTTATTTTATFARPHHRRTPSASSRTLSPSPTTRPYSALTAGLAASRGAGGVGGMPSPRTSPAMRPTSPLSPGAYKPSPAAGQYFDLLQPPQRPPHSRSNSNHQLSPHAQPQPHQQPQQQNQQHRHNRSLRLPSFSLPRFHPSRFPSATSSVQSTPDGNSHSSSPQPPMSPRAYQRMYNDAQKQLYFNQHQLFVVATATAAAATSAGRPTSPRLAPLGSPGPVTPLELERDEGYLVAGARNVTHSTTTSTSTAAAAAVAATTPSDLADKMVQAEVARQTTG